MAVPCDENYRAGVFNCEPAPECFELSAWCFVSHASSWPRLLGTAHDAGNTQYAVRGWAVNHAGVNGVLSLRFEHSSDEFVGKYASKNSTILNV